MENNYEIRKIHVDQLNEALRVVWNSFNEFVSCDYDKEGTDEFKKFIAYESMKEKLLNSELIIYGCYDDKKIIGVGAMRLPSHISLLFVDKLYHRQGIGMKLFNKMKECLISNTQNKEMTVNASPYAKEFYHYLGFEDTDTEKIVNGIKFTPMKICYRKKDI